MTKRPKCLIKNYVLAKHINSRKAFPCNYILLYVFSFHYRFGRTQKSQAVNPKDGGEI